MSTFISLFNLPKQALIVQREFEEKINLLFHPYHLPLKINLNRTFLFSSHIPVYIIKQKSQKYLSYTDIRDIILYPQTIQIGTMFSYYYFPKSTRFRIYF